MICAGHVDHERAQQCVVGALLGGAQAGPGAGQQLGAGERAVQVVVGAGIERVVRRAALGLHGDGQHPRLLEARVVTQGAADPGGEAFWESEVTRFYGSLESFDQFLASDRSLQASLESVFQAPIADALTHIGQLALLRRMAGDPIPGEAYRLAEIVAGRVGQEQAKPRREYEESKGAIWSKHR